MTIHWADVAASELADKGPHTLATGITPSGPVHIGNMREVMTAEAVYRALLDRGVEARLIYIADTYDRLRRLYPFLPKSFEEHIGKPLSEIPCPDGCCKSYADHFLLPFLGSLEELGIKPEIYRADALYKEGKYNDAIKTALLKRDEIARILKEFQAAMSSLTGRLLTPSATSVEGRTPPGSRAMTLRRRLWTTSASAEAQAQCP
jgi:lysyl-tRNA synthetase class 1